MAGSPDATVPQPRRGARLSVFEHAHDDIDMEARIQLPEGVDPGQSHGHVYRSELMQRVAAGFAALEETERRQTEQLLQEEEHSRKRYIAQFQSLARKVDSLEEEARQSVQFREETTEVLKGLRRAQQNLAEDVETMRGALRDLDRLVRASLPSQLEALAALSKDIQSGLKSKADLAAVASDMQALEARLQRAEQGVDAKLERSELDHAQRDMGQFALSEEVERALGLAIEDLTRHS